VATVTKRRLLVVDDEPLLRVAISDALRKEGWTVDEADNGVDGAALFKQKTHNLVVVDLVMPQMDGMELMRRIKSVDPSATVVMMTAHGSVDRAVEAMRNGAADFITKPFSMGQLLVHLENVCSIRTLREQNVRLQQQLETRHSFSRIVGKSPQMQQLFDLIKVVAKSDASVLIHGESGTGKEMVANAIHYNSRRRKEPYIRLSCASLPETLIESELFGYEKGAFTGASQRRIGRFEAASGGTLFLDEVSELPPTFQVKLLRTLQEHQIERLGSNSSVYVDVRIISASLRPLEEEIAAGRFREDLFFRVNTVSIHVPPLRERREDIPLLAEIFLQELLRETDRPIQGFTDEALGRFDRYLWPGNVRELKHAVERAVLFSRGSHISVADLPDPLRSFGKHPPAGRKRNVATLQQATEQAEIEAIRAAFVASHGRRGPAAALLGISRKTLWEKVKQYGIAVEARPRTPSPTLVRSRPGARRNSRG
jgi:DNA-binding NtrC family response regulator